MGDAHSRRCQYHVPPALVLEAAVGAAEIGQPLSDYVAGDTELCRERDCRERIGDIVHAGDVKCDLHERSVTVHCGKGRACFLVERDVCGIKFTAGIKTESDDLGGQSVRDFFIIRDLPVYKDCSVRTGVVCKLME